MAAKLEQRIIQHRKSKIDLQDGENNQQKRNHSDNPIFLLI